MNRPTDTYVERATTSAAGTNGGTLIDRLAAHAESQPNAPAILSPVGQVSYASLARQLLQLSARLEQLGVTQESRVCFAQIGDPEHLLAMLACLQLGATVSSPGLPDTPNPINGPDLPGIQWDEAGQSTPRLKPLGDDAVLLFSTSGTTGTPKLVVLQSADLVAQAPRHVPTPDTRFACLAPITHNFSRRHRLYCLAQGAASVFIDTRPERLVDSCLSLGVSTLHVTVFQARELLALPDAQRLATLQLKLGGSYVPRELRAALRSRITANAVFGYGTTETGAIAFTDANDPESDDTVGTPLPGVEVAIRDDEGQVLPASATGEIVVRCRGVFRAYWAQPELTHQRLQSGWFHTGDLGQLDAAGRLQVQGRVDDMFVFTSWNIYPQLIEAELCALPGVSDAAVLPLPSDVHGHIPVALVVPDTELPANLDAVRQSLRATLGMRCPRQLLPTTAIPRNAGGKIMRAEALQQFLRLQGQPA